MQHISVIGRDVAFVVLILLLLGLDEMVLVVAFFSLIILFVLFFCLSNIIKLMQNSLSRNWF